MKSYGIISIILTGTILSCSSQSQSVEHTHTDYFAAYELEDEIFGTKTQVTISSDTRTMVTNSLPNHETGEFPTQGNPNTISAQNISYTFPLNPTYTGEAIWIREPGVALNGVKFEPGTAEVVVCDTGESYRVEAFQELINLGLDFNHAHVQPTGAYHYHGTPTSVIENFDIGKDLVHIGFAKDGFPLYFSKSNAYKPSYKLLTGKREGEDCTYSNPKNTIDVLVADKHDGTYTSDFEFVEGSGDLDECNGITLNGNYMYLVTDSFPYVGRCLMGEVTENLSSIGQLKNAQLENKNQRPNAEILIKQMDINKDGKLSKDEVKGPLINRFEQFDANEDGYLTNDELKSGQKRNMKRPINKARS